MALMADPAAWAALIALVVMEVVLGIDNLVFISILSNKLPEDQRSKARRIGIALALVLRLALLSTIAFLVGLTQPVFSLPFQGPAEDRKSTRLNSSHVVISYAVFCLKKKNKYTVCFVKKNTE